MADMAQKIAMADAERAPLLAAAGLLLLVVFALKAALLPLYFWLPRAYAAASAPVAALFAIMTKVGIYSILRVYTLVFGEAAGELANLAQAWLWPLALATLGLGAIGALAARTLQGLLAYLVVVSAGTLLAGVALGSERALAASLYYLLHSTWIAGGLFLLADLVARQRGDKAGDLVRARRCRTLGCSAGPSSSVPSPSPVCRHCRGSSARSCFCSRSLPAARRWPCGAWYWAVAWWRWWR